MFFPSAMKEEGAHPPFSAIIHAQVGIAHSKLRRNPLDRSSQKSSRPMTSKQPAWYLTFINQLDAELFYFLELTRRLSTE